MALLEVRNLSVTYGGLKANDDVSVEVRRGQVVGLIGPNGAGKTTFIDALTGICPTSGGSIYMDGTQIDRMRPHERVRSGISRSFQSVQMFEDLTIEANLRVAAESLGWRTVAELFRLHRSAAEEEDPLWALDLLGIGDLAGELPGHLSHGQRRLAGIARALAARPQVVLLDEPAAGLDRNESVALGARIGEVVAEGVTMLLVDHDMGLVLDVCDYLYVLEFGRIIAQGEPDAIRKDTRVLEAYLGEDHRADGVTGAAATRPAAEAGE